MIIHLHTSCTLTLSFDIPYIRLLKTSCFFFPANFTLKSCINLTRLNFWRNSSESWKYHICRNRTNVSQVWYSRLHSGKREHTKKTIVRKKLLMPMMQVFHYLPTLINNFSIVFWWMWGVFFIFLSAKNMLCYVQWKLPIQVKQTK